MLPIATCNRRVGDPNVADTETTPDTAADAFISKWQGVTASELSTSQSFLIDLSHLPGG